MDENIWRNQERCPVKTISDKVCTIGCNSGEIALPVPADPKKSALFLTAGPFGTILMPSAWVKYVEILGGRSCEDSLKKDRSMILSDCGVEEEHAMAAMVCQSATISSYQTTFLADHGRCCMLSPNPAF